MTNIIEVPEHIKRDILEKARRLKTPFSGGKILIEEYWYFHVNQNFRVDKIEFTDGKNSFWFRPIRRSP